MSTAAKRFVLLASAAALWAAATLAGAPADGGTMVKPRYAAPKELLLPEGYETWVFLGASLGLSYREEARADGLGTFHHIYMQPEAYGEYRATGRFPEGTMLVMEVHKPEQKVSINKHGYFEGERVALEVAVKDRSAFEEGWAYFDFANGTRKSSKPFPRESCFNCHREHGADDNVFTQFYPVLRKLKKK